MFSLMFVLRTIAVLSARIQMPPPCPAATLFISELSKKVVQFFESISRTWLQNDSGFWAIVAGGG